MTNDEILEAIGNKSVFELAELIDAFKSKFNVTIAAAPVGGPAAGGGGAAAAPAVEEKTEFDVLLKDAGGKKSGHQVVREMPAWASRKRRISSTARRDREPAFRRTSPRRSRQAGRQGRRWK
jgi:hypothetical protein